MRHLAFTHIGGVARHRTFDAPIGTTDTVEFTVHYDGDPIMDASGFGGFYTATSLTYNLGVAFQSDPSLIRSRLVPVHGQFHGTQHLRIP